MFVGDSECLWPAWTSAVQIVVPVSLLMIDDNAAFDVVCVVPAQPSLCCCTPPPAARLVQPASMIRENDHAVFKFTGKHTGLRSMDYKDRLLHDREGVRVSPDLHVQGRSSLYLDEILQVRPRSEASAVPLVDCGAIEVLSQWIDRNYCAFACTFSALLPSW